MSDRSKTVSSTSAKAYKSRPSTVGPPLTTRRLSGIVKNRHTHENTGPIKLNKNSTVMSESDISIRPDLALADSETENKHISYGKFLRSMLEDCLLNEKIEREETEIDKDIALLADRFQKTMSQLDKTNRRIKDITFIVEQKRLLELRRLDNVKILEATSTSNAMNILTDLASTEQRHIDKLTTKNVDFGYDKNTGYKQLLDAVSDAIVGLEDIKKHSNLDMNKFKEYESSKTMMEQIELSRMEMQTLKSEFEAKFPKFSEKLLKEASEKFAKMIENDKH